MKGSWEKVLVFQPPIPTNVHSQEIQCAQKDENSEHDTGGRQKNKDDNWSFEYSEKIFLSRKRHGHECLSYLL